MSIAARLTELGIDLPQPAAAVANYVPFVRTGNLVHISGQLSNDAAGGVLGTVGVEVTPERAKEAARMCGVNLLAQMSAALDGDLERVEAEIDDEGGKRTVTIKATEADWASSRLRVGLELASDFDD
eukprot:gene38676-50806_t